MTSILNEADGPESFLLSICDMRVNYYGCENADAMRKLDSVTIWFHVASFLCCLAVLLKRIARMTLNRRMNFGPVDLICLFSMLFHIFKSSLFINLHFSTGTASHDEMAHKVRLNMYFELLAWGVGSSYVSVFTISVAKSVANTNLMEPIMMRGKRVDVGKAIGILRLVLLAIYLILFSLWAYSDSVEKFIFYRRASFLTIGIVSIAVSAPILAFFGYRVIGTLRASQGKSMRVKSGERSINTASILQNSKSPVTTAPNTNDLKNIKLWNLPSAIIRRRSSESKKSVIRISYRIYLMTLFIHIVVWAVYVNLGILCISYVIVSEFFPHDSQVLIFTKGIFDFYLWFNVTHYVFYLYARGQDD